MSSHLFDIVESQIIENRATPRHAVRESGTLCGVTVAVRTISRTGAQFACAAAVRGTLSALRRGHLLPAELALHEPAAMTVELIYTRREGDLFLMGVRFVDEVDGAFAVVDDYVRRLEG